MRAGGEPRWSSRSEGVETTMLSDEEESSSGSEIDSLSSSVSSPDASAMSSMNFDRGSRDLRRTAVEIAEWLESEDSEEESETKMWETGGTGTGCT